MKTRDSIACHGYAYHSESEYPSSTVFSPLSLVLIIAITLVLSYWMVPSNQEAARRLLNDGQVQRAAAMIRAEDAPEAETAAAAVVTEEETLHLVETLLESSGPGEHSLEGEKFVHLLSGLAEFSKVEELISRHAETIGKAHASSLYLSLGDVALAKSHPEAASRAYALALAGDPESKALVTKMVHALRAQAKAGEALTAFENWLTTSKFQLREDEALTELYTGLLRENNQSGRAMDVVLPSLHQPPTEAEVTLIEKLTGESSRTADGIPVLLSYLKSNAQGKQLVSSLMADSLETEIDPMVYARAKTLATYYEWQDMPSEAFTLHHNLALQGDRESLKRCIALYDGLDRESDLCSLLQKLPEKLLKPSDHHLLATLLTHGGDVQGATAQFESYLKAHTEDTSAISELASLHAASGDLSGAATLLASALKIAPHDQALLTDYGDLLISTDRAREALPVYEELSRDAKNDEALERFALLAENLDEPALLAEALNRQIACVPKPCPDLQLALARTMSQLGESEANISVFLADAIKESPEQPCLRIALAKILVQTPQAADAVPLLATAELAGSAEGVELLCEAVQNGADPRLVAEFVKKNPTASTIAIAPEYQETRRTIVSGEAAKELAAKEGDERSVVPDIEDYLNKLREEADASYRSGNTAVAFAKISTYFEKTPLAHPADWNLLGHIYQSMGQTEKSRKAFEKSLNSLSPTPATATTRRAITVSSIP
jgi:tetratricopeptide (TPR) repeat protein